MSTFKYPKINFSLVVFVIFLLLSLSILAIQAFPGIKNNLLNFNKQELKVVVAPELEEVLTKAANDFGSTSKFKINLTTLASGSMRTQFAAGKIAPNLLIPTSSVWLDLINLDAGQKLFETEKLPILATSPVGIGIWESKLNLLKQKFNTNDLDYDQILQVASSGGWQKINTNVTQTNVYGGFTNPQVSTTGLSALIAQYYEAATKNNLPPEKLSLNDVNNLSNQAQISNLQNVIRHYSQNTVIFRDYLNRGPDYLDFLPLAENDLVYVNSAKGGTKPPEKLVMLYPKTGSIVHNYPLAINNSGTNAAQKQGLQDFENYLQKDEIQKNLMSNGFRPSNKSIQLDSPLSSDFGIDPNQPSRKLELPPVEVIDKILTNWNFVKKKSRIILALDTSGSMQGAKLDNAKKALQLFTDNLKGRNDVGLVNFDNTVNFDADPSNVESNKATLQAKISSLQAQGSTSLYDGINGSLDKLQSISSLDKSSDTINAVIILSDGADTNSQSNLKSVTDKIENLQKSSNPILVVPVGYGDDADYNTLNALARASKTTVQKGGTGDIEKLFQDISSYF